MTPDYEIGDVVICINDTMDTTGPWPIKKGALYRVQFIEVLNHLMHSPLGDSRIGVHLRDVPSPNPLTGYHPGRFKRLPKSILSIKGMLHVDRNIRERVGA